MYYGKERWKFQSDKEIPLSPTIAYGYKMVSFGNNSGNIYGVDMYNGQGKWKYKNDMGITSSPAIVDVVVSFGSIDGYLYAVDINTGQEKWKFKTDKDITSSPTIGKANGSDHSKPDLIDHPNPELNPNCFVIYARWNMIGFCCGQVKYKYNSHFYDVLKSPLKRSSSDNLCL